MVQTKVNAMGRVEEGHPGRDPPRKATTITGGVCQAGRAIEGAGRLLRSSPTRQLAQMVAEVGLAPTALGEAGHMRPTIGGKVPCKEFLKCGLKRPQREQLQMVALSKIYQYQRRTELLICKWPFMCLVHETVQVHGAHDLHFQVHAVQVLWEPTKYVPPGGAYLCAIYARCVTIMPKDIHLAHCILGQQTKWESVSFFLLLWVVACHQFLGLGE